MDPYEDKKRPRFPEIVSDVLTEEQEEENEGLWKTVLKRDPELRERVKEREEELEEELENDFGNTGRLERTLEDLI